jgi:hypothetical protein
MEELLLQENLDIKVLDLQTMDLYWDKVKAEEKSSNH